MFLRKLKPILTMVPEIAMSDRVQPFADRVSMTFFTLLIFLSMYNFPIYGIKWGSMQANPFYHQRLVMAASSGTLMELGVSHILTSSIMMQILCSAKVIVVNNSVKEERALLQGFQKFIAIMIALAQSVLYVLAGFYGSVGILKGLLIMFQLFASSLIVIYLDEMLQKGYGIGSGISLFTCGAVSLEMIWKVIGPASIPVYSDTGVISNSTEYVGAALALPHALFTREDRVYAFLDIAFGRMDSEVMSSISGIAVSILLAGAVAHLLMWRVEVVVSSIKHRSAQGKLPIKFLYTSNIPLAIYAVVAGNIFMVSQIIYFAFPSAFFTKLTGRWIISKAGGYLQPVDGLPYYLSYPTSLRDLLFDPFHGMFYLVLVLAFVATVSKLWIEISGTNSRGIAKDLRDKQMAIKGHRGGNLEHELNRNIPTAAALGGMVLSGLAVLADMCGSAVSGAGVVMVVTIVFQYYEICIRENGDMFSQLLGE